MNRKPTILLGMPTDNLIYQTIETALKHHGFQVVSAIQPGRDFHYPSCLSRLKIKFQQVVLHDGHAKDKLKSKILLKHVEKEITRYGGVDYALFIRGDIYTEDFLQTIKRHVRHKMINYQWDGLSRFSKIHQYIGLFDKFYVFDPADLINRPGLLPATNFYFDHIPTISANPKHDLYFVGLHYPNRVEEIGTFAKAAEKLGLSLDFHIGSLDIPPDILSKQYPDNIQTFQGIRSFADNLNATQTQAKVLTDFKTPAHNGLSFRPFEALGYRKKLITTNTDITRYDFYHPDNIFVWQGNNLDGLKTFMDKPYHEMPSEIYEKYSFGNWIRYILDIHPHHPIDLPK
ncbi:hypothetical protein [Neisseria yangbaofengii]|uniref:hypothetical protein n=1 Tax=Neisseria yangbaofengii TaxID=2709396 RepID=UPI0013EC1B04|nr:hypothetical protein [Neisseria yangbaofengii]